MLQVKNVYDLLCKTEKIKKDLQRGKKNLYLRMESGPENCGTQLRMVKNLCRKQMDFNTRK